MTDEKNIVKMYLNEIRKIPLLSHEEETDLAIKASQGDLDARNKIVQSNLRFVVNVAKQYRNRGLDFEDLISEGNIGLLNAIEKFDANKGYHFISYAVWWIRQAINRAINEKGHAIRLPHNKINQINMIEKTRLTVGRGKSEADQIKAIGLALGLEESYIRDMLNISRELISLDADMSPSSDGSISLSDFIEDELYESPETALINASLKEELSDVLETLRPNEAKVLKLRYGLTGEEPKSLQEVGEICNLTKERIRQIEHRAISRMQHPTRIGRLESFVA